MEDYPWGGTVIASEVREPVYPDVVAKRIGDLYLDMGNALVVHLLDVVVERVKTAADDVLNAGFRILITANEERLFDYYMVNTLSLTHFEAGMYLHLTEQLCYENSDIGNEIVRYFNDERGRRLVRKSKGDSEKREAIVELLGEQYTTGDYLRLIERELDIDPSTVIDNEILDRARAVRGDRGSLVHNFTHLFQSGEVSEVKEQVRDCVELVERMQELLHEELIINQAIFQSL